MANAEGASEPVIRADEDLERRSQGKADSAPIQSCSLGLSTELEFRPCLQNRTNLDAERRTSNTCEQRGCRYDNITVNSGSGGPVHIGNKFTYKVCSHDSSSSETTDAHAKRIVQGNYSCNLWHNRIADNFKNGPDLLATIPLTVGVCNLRKFWILVSLKEPANGYTRLWSSGHGTIKPNKRKKAGVYWF